MSFFSFLGGAATGGRGSIEIDGAGGGSIVIGLIVGGSSIIGTLTGGRPTSGALFSLSFIGAGAGGILIVGTSSFLMSGVDGVGGRSSLMVGTSSFFVSSFL